MAEKLTKTALKDELQRRISYFEKTYGFNANENSVFDFADKPHKLKAYGRYLALFEMKWQIENNLFIGGYAA